MSWMSSSSSRERCGNSPLSAPVEWTDLVRIGSYMGGLQGMRVSLTSIVP